MDDTTAYRLLRDNEPLLRLLCENRVHLADVYHIGIYEQYRRMRRQGCKASYAAAMLAERHGTTVRTIYNIIRRLGRRVRVR